jgi:hypothetical protein
VVSDVQRYFSMDDGVRYTVVARDLEHAEQILRESGTEFGQYGSTYEEAKSNGEVDWEEIPDERVWRMRVHRGEPGEVDPVPLATCKIGEWFCSEW